MPTWLVAANALVLFAAAVALIAGGVHTYRERISRPIWKRRHVLRTPAERAQAGREAATLDGSERREALRWRAYWIAKELSEYGEATHDDELRLAYMLFDEITMHCTNEKIGSPRSRMDRLRNLVDLMLPFLPEDERWWWRSDRFSRELAQVIHWADVEKWQRQRDRATSGRPFPARTRKTAPGARSIRWSPKIVANAPGDEPEPGGPAA
jgi:hypothetical protein